MSMVLLAAFSLYHNSFGEICDFFIIFFPHEVRALVHLAGLKWQNNVTGFLINHTWHLVGSFNTQTKTQEIYKLLLLSQKCQRKPWHILHFSKRMNRLTYNTCKSRWIIQIKHSNTLWKDTWGYICFNDFINWLIISHSYWLPGTALAVTGSEAIEDIPTPAALAAHTLNT